jgi:hypothetical protein
MNIYKIKTRTTELICPNEQTAKDVILFFMTPLSQAAKDHINGKVDHDYFYFLEEDAI